MFNEFKAFVMRGNVLDLAIAVIIGGAFATITKSLTDDLIMPVVGWLFGGFDFSSYFIRLGPIPENYAGSATNYAALKEAGVPLLGYGEFITVVINFLILAFIIFMLVRSANKMMARFDAQNPAPEAEAADIVLLREIRDELKAQRGEK
ncbi:large conductance mechanosensitive channel protein MscL [Hephaestia sp. GCM10023244]|uniref:large conductance mechanosensitive channel protein MscL n=1 Tax=unclassified Hephaestia TaxID=2631281 RepID=UPI002076FFC0|nr:large conductance mechanosensitive channel protein MscL [Hephaestia sp. MAHUQ-44]MCM8731874.1 large conductance mechanosensitive channel protein MscL [Hephaestia sp. MAHUQ-44]